MQPAAQGDGAQGQQRGGGGGLLGMVMRMAFFWWLMNYMKGGNKGPTQPLASSLFQRGEPVDMLIYFDTAENIKPELLNDETPLWEINGMKLATEDVIAKNLTFELPESVQNNGSLYLHVFVMREGHDFEEHNAFYSIAPLTHYGPKRKEVKEKNLLFEDAEEPEEEEEEGPREIVNYWKPKLTVAIVDDFSKYARNTVPPHLRPFIMFDREADYYYPMIYFNEFWLLKRHMTELNTTVDEVTIELTLSTIRPWIIQMITQVEESFKMQESMGLNSDEETDEFKKILVEGNPVLLGVTFAVSMLHSVFDFLAFKNDIGFWRSNRSMEGLSARSILINAGCQLVIFLYLMDNDTSFVVLVSAGIGVLIEFWKITKAMKVTLQWKHGIPLPHFEDRASYSNSETKKHDAQAMKYLSYVLYPLVVGYSIYALINESHKSWYSWILNSLVGAVYAFGFILMCPQLYLNYKLKSVAHLPWRQLTYKFLNTIIDDLFAFVITMPWLHRLSVFRDDVVFLIYLYQWYIYGVDKSRVNEFGFSEVDHPAEDTSTQTKAIESEDAPSAETSNGTKAAETPVAETDGSENEQPGLVQRKKERESQVGEVEEVQSPRLHGEDDESKKTQ